MLQNVNQQSVIRVLQKHGPCSRADVTRRLDVTAPTVSKAVASLVRGRMVEEFDVEVNGIGRPAKRLRLATETAQVLGLVIDARQCRLVASGLNGKPLESVACRFDTPKTYAKLIQMTVRRAQRLMDREGVTTLGLGISMPGLIDYRRQKGLLSPNVPITNGKSPARDLGSRLGLKSVMLQETHALCIAERHVGEARDGDDFAMLDVSTGLGLGVMTSGRVLTGHSGIAGEIGHIPYVEDGRPCGCGKRGCLETVASDTALAWRVSKRVGRELGIEQVIQSCAAGKLSVRKELEQVLAPLSFALSTVISLFNPANLFVYGRLFELDCQLFDRLLDETARRTLGPAMDDCQIVQARGSKSQGSLSGIIEYLTDSLSRDLNGFSRGHSSSTES